MSKKNVTSKEKDIYEGDTEVETLWHNVHALIKPHPGKDKPFV